MKSHSFCKLLKYFILLGVVSSCLFCNNSSAIERDPFTAGGYELVWVDEFDKDGPPNPDKWVFEKGFVRNHEAQWYQEDNAVCKDGLLRITAREEIKRNPLYVKGSTDWKETKFVEFTSSSLMTQGLHSWTMGRFVMRAKIPHGEGMWPAFWTVGEKGEWPSSGEIDIMEYYQDKILANVAHGSDRRWNAVWNSTNTPVSRLGGKKWLDEFHVWRMDWDTESIRLYVDDRLLNETKLADTNNANLKWGPRNPFHHPHYVIINLALGGDNGGDPEKARLPAEYLVDYVRVYQREVDKAFKAVDDYVAPKPYAGKRVGIHYFSEYPLSVNKRCGWEAGCDSRSYAWKPQGSNRESATLVADRNDKLEGELSYRFVLNHGWSRWVVEMEAKYGKGTADFSKFEKIGFGMKSSGAARWDAFYVIIESKGGKTFKVPATSVGFKPEGKWHRCSIPISSLRQAGLDPQAITTLFAVEWGGGVRDGDFFMLDDLYLK